MDQRKVMTSRIAAYTRWAFEEDRTAATYPARRAFQDRFEREVDPDGVLPLAERARRADALRKAYYTRLAYRSVQARRARKSGQNRA